ncbi:hypothetical protein [Streptomyces sp. NPDC050704]|uniref:hypothetical protein n=1 Tax=Streptomyces sp. NPDC050704 TaxID=3157219 RepID=UPI003423080C
MSFGDQGMPHRPPDPYAQWVAERERLRRRRRTRLVAGSAVGVALVAAVAAGVVLYADSGGPGRASDPGKPVPSVVIASPFTQLPCDLRHLSDSC